MESSRISVWVAISVTITLLLLCFAEALRSPATIIGDGREYLAHVHNLVSGHGPYLVEVPPALTDYVQPRIDKLREGQGQALGKGLRYGEFIRDPSGKIFAWHWWGYSAFVVPAYAAMRALHLDPIAAFTVTNIGFVAVLFAYLAFGSRQSAQFRAFVACLFMLSGTSFYLWWSHAEIMTATLAVLGLVAWLDRRPILAAMSLALAATQNPPVALLLAFPAVSLLASLRSGSTDAVKTGMHSAARLAGFALASSISLVPSAWFQSRLGVTNPILAAGGASFEFGNLTKCLDLFFDLNQGMVLLQVLGFAVLATFIAVTLMRWRRSDAARRWLLAKVLALLLITYFMAVLAAAAHNWNPGVTVISRYAYWLTAPVLIAICLVLDSLAAQTRVATFYGLTAGGVVLLGLWGLHGKDVSYETLTAPSKFMMRTLSRHYFPNPEIFCERAQGREQCEFDRRAFSYGRPGRPPFRLLVAEGFLKQQCGGAAAVETPIKRERYLGMDLLWFSGFATCPSGLRIGTS